MSKLKSPWVITDIPKTTKVKLWRLMKDNPTYKSWEKAIVGKSYTTDRDKIFTGAELDFMKMSKDTYNSLKKEVMLMPLKEVNTLPSDLQNWIFELRPDLKEEQAEQEAKTSTLTTLGEPYEETPHKQKMRELAKTLAEGICLPSPWDRGLWRDIPIEFKPGEYSLSLGAVEIDKGIKIKVKYHALGSGIAEPYLAKALFSHLSTSSLPKFTELVGGKGKLNNLVSKAGQYSQALLLFLKLIADEVRGYRAKVNFRDEVKPGLTKWFIMTAWNDAIQKAGGYSWIDDSWYKPHESISGTNLWQLRCGAYGIGIAKSNGALRTYENWHKNLRVKYASHQSAKDIHIKSQELEVIAQEIRQLLEEFSDTERLPGRCKLCLRNESE